MKTRVSSAVLRMLSAVLLVAVACMLVAMTLVFGGGTAFAQAQPAPPTISTRLSSAALIDDQHADLKVTLNFPTRQEKAVINVAGDPAVQITPPRADLQNVQGPVIVHFDVVGLRRQLRPGDHVISADLSLVGAAGSTTVASDSVTLSYARRIRFFAYLIWGLAGVAVGYFLRLLTKVLGSIPAPAPAPVDPNAPKPTNPAAVATGKITAFVQDHYYSVEFAVTCVLGFLALLALAKSGMAPDGAAYWYGALLLGVSLGFLTNTDLILRIK